MGTTMAKKMTPEEQVAAFWGRVRKSDGCWEWTASTNPSGYGQGVTIPGVRRQTSAHRASWILHNGPIPRGLFVCHRCDNRRCVRPDHLFLGTALDNNRDAARKGRNAWGPRSPHAKITAEQAQEVIDLYAGGMLQRDIAARFALQKSTVCRIVRGVRWKRLGDRSAVPPAQGHGPRVKRGEGNGRAKLSEAQVLEIRRIHRETGLKSWTLAKRLGLSQGMVAGIITGKTWRHLHAA
jgi:transposase